MIGRVVALVIIVPADEHCDATSHDIESGINITFNMFEFAHLVLNVRLLFDEFLFRLDAEEEVEWVLRKELSCFDI